MTTIDPRRLFSTSNPLIAGRDLQAFAKSARDVEDERVDQRWRGVLTDEDYLLLASELTRRNPTTAQAAKAATVSMNFVASSAVLWVPSSPQQKEYQGHIAIETLSGGSLQFAAVTTNGPDVDPHRQAKVWDRSTALEPMLRRLSEQLQAKESGKGSSMYQPKPGSAVQWPRRIDRSSFDRAFRVAANRVQT